MIVDFSQRMVGSSNVCLINLSDRIEIILCTWLLVGQNLFEFVLNLQLHALIAEVWEVYVHAIDQWKMWDKP